MSKTAKILIIVELLLSVAFCFVTLVLYTNRQNFKKLYEQQLQEYNQQVTKYNDLQKDMTKQSEEFQKKKIELTDEIELKDTRIKTMEQQLSDKDGTINSQKNAIDQYKADIANKDEQLKKRHDKIVAQTDEINKLKQNLEDANRNENEAVEKNIALQDLNSSQQQQIVSLTKKLNNTQDKLEEKNWTLKRLEEYGVPISTIVLKKEKEPVKPIDGYVVAVKEGLNLIMLSVGKEDGVKSGYMFTLYRDGDYIGKAKVEEVYNDMCSALLIKKYMNQNNLKVQEGDNASTKVY